MREDRRQERRTQRSPLDMSFLNTYYQDNLKEKIREDLVVSHAERIGKTLAQVRLTSSQLRKFFNEVRSIESRIETSDFERQKPMIKMLKSKIAYSVGKKTSGVPIEFKDFIDTCVDKINDKRDFEAFVKFFESIVGYYYFYGGK